MDKRHLDRLSSGFIKRNSDEALEDALLKLEYYLAQTIVNKLRTKGEEGLTESKRAFDRMGMGLWKKRSGDNMYGEISKRRFDRMGMGLIKRVPSVADDNIEQEKRRFDRLGSGFIKKSSAGTDKRYFDRLGTGLLKRQSNEKRYMDRLGAGLLWFSAHVWVIFHRNRRHVFISE